MGRGGGGGDVGTSPNTCPGGRRPVQTPVVVSLRARGVAAPSPCRSGERVVRPQAHQCTHSPGFVVVVTTTGGAAETTEEAEAACECFMPLEIPKSSSEAKITITTRAVCTALQAGAAPDGCAGERRASSGSPFGGRTTRGPTAGLSSGDVSRSSMETAFGRGGDAVGRGTAVDGMILGGGGGPKCVGDTTGCSSSHFCGDPF